jgi:hypothetical protein
MNDQDQNFSKSKLLEQIRSEHGLLEATLARLTHAQMLIPGVDGEWSAKDALAHISTWERWMISWTNSLLRAEKPGTPASWDVDRMNAETFARVREFALADVLQEFRLSYWDSLALAESLGEKQLLVQYPDTWPMGPLWKGIEDNTSGHYKQHREDIQAWLNKRGH